MIGLILGGAAGVIVFLLLLGIVVTVNIGSEGRLDEMVLETTGGVVYRTLVNIEGVEGVMVGENRQAQWLSRQDMKEMLEVLDETEAIAVDEDAEGDCLFFNPLTDAIEREDCESSEEVKEED